MRFRNMFHKYVCVPHVTYCIRRAARHAESPQPLPLRQQATNLTSTERLNFTGIHFAKRLGASALIENDEYRGILSRSSAQLEHLPQY